MKDENIKRWFADEQRMVIKEAIEDHRASCNHVPRTIYGKIVSTADRTIVDMDNTIKRSYTYGKKNYIGLSEEEQFERVYEHLVEKYGENGYAKVYLEDKEFDEAVSKLRQALENREEFIERVKRVVNDLQLGKLNVLIFSYLNISGKELGKGKGGISFLTRDVVTRIELTKNALVMALTSHINGDMWR